MTCQMDIISCREWMLGSVMHRFPLVIKQIIMLIPWLFLVSNKQTTWKFLHFHICFENLTLVFEICSGLWFGYWQCYGCSKRRDRHEDIFSNLEPIKHNEGWVSCKEVLYFSCFQFVPCKFGMYLWWDLCAPDKRKKRQKKKE